MSHDSQLSVLMFTDVVDSVGLLDTHGVGPYKQALQRHNALFERYCAELGGTVVKSTGDGYLATFKTVVAAVRAALVFQHALRTEAWGEVRLETRIGMHVGEFASIEVSGREDIVGHSPNLTARLMSLGTGGQVLLTRTAFDEGRQFVSEHPPLPDGSPPPALSWVAHGPYIFKGAETQPIEVFEVGATGLAPLAAPPNSDKAWRQIVPSSNPLIDWRAAAGVEVPGRSNWTIQRRLGEGGFGEVWLAAHRRTGQHRVFKFCYDAERLRSLKKEFVISHLIRTLGERDDIGVIDEVQLDQPPYFLESEWSTEGSIVEWMQKMGGIGALPLEKRLEIVIAVAHALAAAHSVGVLHKDIKPGNILMHIVGGQPRPRLVDFGIGTVLDPARIKQWTLASFIQESRHSSGTSGTLLYLPPEVLEGGDWTTQGDIYSLGVVLYQITAGDSPKAPWYKRTVHGWQADVADELLREDIGRCLERDPSRRIQSAADLAAQLEQLPQRRVELAEQMREIQEEEAERLEAQRNEAKLRKMQARLIRVALFAALLVCALLLWGFLKKGRLIALQGEIARLEEQKIQDEKLARIAARFSEKALLHLEEDDPAAAALWFTEGMARAKGKAAPDEQLDRRRIACALRAMPALFGASVFDRANYLELSPRRDFAFLAGRGEERPGPETDTARSGQAQLWFFDGRGTVALDFPPLERPASVVRAAFDAAGAHVAAVTDTGWLFLWKVAGDESGRRAPILAHSFGSPLSDVAFHPSRPELLLVAKSRRATSTDQASGQAIVFAWPEKRALATLEHTLPLNRAIFAPDGSVIATAAGDQDRGGGECQLWHWEAKPVRAKSFAHAAAVNWLHFSPNGARLLTASGTQNTSAGEAQVWDVQTLWPVAPPFRHAGAVLMAHFDSTGARIVTASQREGLARIWKSDDSAHPLLTLPHDGNVFTARWSADDRLVITGSRDQAARVWDSTSGALAVPLLHHGGTVSQAWFAAHDRYIATVTTGAARLWDLGARQPEVAPVHGPGVEKLATASADGQWLALASEPDPAQQTTEVRVAATATGALRGAILRLPGTVTHLAFSPDAATLAIAIQYRPTAPGKMRGEVRLHDFTAGPEVRLLHDEIPSYVAFPSSRSPRLLIVVKQDATASARRALVWDRVTAALEREFSLPESLPIDCAAISPDGALLAIGGGSTQPRRGLAPIFDIATGTTIATAHHDETVRAIAFDPSSTRVVTGAVDDEVRVWSGRAATEPLMRRRHTADVTSVAFIGDGSRVLSTSADATAALWQVADGRLLGTGRHRAVVRCAAASADGAFIVTGGDDRTVRVWDAAAFRPIAIFPQSAQLEMVGFTAGDARVFGLGFAQSEATAAPSSNVPLDRIETPLRRAEFRLWDFASDQRPLEKLANDAQRLGGREVPRGEEPALERLRPELWAGVLPPATGAQTLSLPELAAWHHRESAHAFGASLWQAAAWQTDARLACLTATADDLLASAQVHFQAAHWPRVGELCQQAQDAAPSPPVECELRRLRAMAAAELALRRPGAAAAGQTILQDLQQVVAEAGGDSFLLTALAEYFACHGAWSESEAALAQACALEAADPHGARPAPWQRLAALHLLRDPPQLDHYVATCEAMLARFQAIPAYAPIVARSCLWHPQASTGRAEALVTLARQGVIEAPTSFHRLNTLGAALVRSGRHSEAIECLDDARQFFSAASTARRDPHSQGRPVDWIFLALAEHGLQRPEAARRWLALAESGHGEPRQSWASFEVALLLRQAKSALEANTRLADPPETRELR